jgi:type I restriction enzyme S subunit
MMKGWKSHRLSELADMCLGKMLDQRKNKGELYPYLANINVQWGKINLDDLRDMRFESTEFDRYGINKGDIVMCEGGEPGRCAIWKGQKENMMIQKALHRIRAKSHVDSFFLYYSLLYNGLHGYFTGYFTGSAIKHLTGINLAKININLPPLPTQRKIASILSGYDDLIENNLKRIQLLEEKAQITYEEWFVKMRFPGYETAIFDKVTGLPEGWTYDNFSSIADIVSGFPFKSSTYIKEGKYKVVTIKNVQDGRFVPTTTDTLETIPAKVKSEQILSTSDIILSLTGNVGRSCLVYGKYYLLNQRVAKIVEKKASYKAYIKYLLSSRSVMTNLENISNGTAQQNMSPINMGNMKIIIPDSYIIEKFGHNFNKTIDLICKLNLQNQFLKEARDILLPRLMSGMIDVEELEIEMLQTIK